MGPGALYLDVLWDLRVSRPPLGGEAEAGDGYGSIVLLAGGSAHVLEREGHYDPASFSGEEGTELDGDHAGGGVGGLRVLGARGHHYGVRGEATVC